MVISELIPWIAGVCFGPGESHRPPQPNIFLNFVYCRRPLPGFPQSLNGRLTVSMDFDPDPVFQSPVHHKINCSQFSLKNAIYRAPPTDKPRPETLKTLAWLSDAMGEYRSEY
ncbi:hypothetical protein AVEN_270983-1 [Araneus ventricosus]|uniref:Uncharacterized protein n=1 Tax=Araneus ventricosus TaxID=182803 RepID=A0A4Y2SIS9_ARAVE|nr:hypothetical protein AVEN_68517-1 [Araneus ventricosus]GBN88992.1 hypothetical protein AVEN_270983-1 [Araneus ventricosus]